jgi:hypothetical protein
MQRAVYAHLFFWGGGLLGYYGRGHRWGFGSDDVSAVKLQPVPNCLADLRGAHHIYQCEQYSRTWLRHLRRVDSPTCITSYKTHASVTRGVSAAPHFTKRPTVTASVMQAVCDGSAGEGGGHVDSMLFILQITCCVSVAQVVSTVPPARVAGAMSGGAADPSDQALLRRLEWVREWTGAMAAADPDPRCRQLAAGCRNLQARRMDRLLTDRATGRLTKRTGQTDGLMDRLLTDRSTDRLTKRTGKTDGLDGRTGD